MLQHGPSSASHSFWLWSPLLFLLAGCALPGSLTAKPVIKECILPQDQNGTLAGRWKTVPIPIAFHSGDFRQDEINDMIASAQSWNTFYGQSLNLAAFDFGTPGSPHISNTARPNPGTICNQGIFKGQAIAGKSSSTKTLSGPIPVNQMRSPSQASAKARANRSSISSCPSWKSITKIFSSLEKNCRIYKPSSSMNLVTC